MPERSEREFTYMTKQKKNWFDAHEAALLSGISETAILRMCADGLLQYKPLLNKQTLTKILNVAEFMIPDVNEDDYERNFNLNDKSKTEKPIKTNSPKVPNVAKSSKGYQIQITVNGVCRTKYLGNVDESLSPSQLKTFLENERDKFKLQILSGLPSNAEPDDLKIKNVSRTGDYSYSIRIMTGGVRKTKTIYITQEQRKYAPEMLTAYLKSERDKFIDEQRSLKKSKLIKTWACA